MLTKALLNTKSDNTAWIPDLAMPLPDIIDSYVDSLYVKATDPQNMLIYRLVQREGDRAAEIIRKWYAEAIKPSRVAQQTLFNELVTQGIARKSALAENFLVAIAPAVLWVNMQLTLQQDCPLPMDEMRSIHKRLLLDILTPLDQIQQ